VDSAAEAGAEGALAPAAEPGPKDAAVVADSNEDSSEDEDDESVPDDCWRSPADNWLVNKNDAVVWELHYWGRCYDRTQLEYNAAVVEQLHKVAREDHEKICQRLAHSHLPSLDRLQARTLHGAPFGHRCRRHFDIAAYQDPASPNASGSDASSEAEDEMEKDGVLSEAKHEEPAVVLA